MLVCVLNIGIETGDAVLGKMSKIHPIPQEALLAETSDEPGVDIWVVGTREN